ncbi:MAG: DUF1631 family protein [Rubrivivax sp.]|nr:DUF1631 family protein [Rubrivivax sp.]
MTPLPSRRLPAQLEAAAHRLKQAARAAVDRTVESLGLAALSAPNLVRRDDLLAAQFELNRKSAAFTLSFNEAFDEWIAREAPSPHEQGLPKATNWDALALVDDHEVEKKITAERFALDVANGCEWELRELDGYVGSLLGQVGETAVRNPLRPEVIGHAVIRGVAAVTERAEVRKVLQTELGRSIGSELRATYADIVSRLRAAGVQPLSLAVRQRSQRVPGGGSEFESSGQTFGSSDVSAFAGAYGAPGGAPGGPAGYAGHGGYGGGHVSHGGYSSRGGHSSHGGHSGYSGYGGPGSGFAASQRGPAHTMTGGGTGGHSTAGHYGPGGLVAPAGGGHGAGAAGLHGGAGSTGGYTTGGYTTGGSGFQRSTRGGATLGTVDATMMALMRRLAVSTAPAIGGNANSYDTSPQALAPNVIRAHRHELREASKGALDHLVIDVIGSLFDAILADSKVPPQLARQIARLQLPVLRAALGDPSFFASRRHPVRRFINRIASLGAAFDDLSADEARDFLAKVRDLVQDIIEGDFELIETYETKLASLEEFAGEMAGRAAAAHGAAPALLAAKEDEAHLTELYSRQLAVDLRGLTAPEFVVHFVTQVWSRVLLRNALQHGGDSEAMRRARQTALDLVMSVQPKPSPAHRKTFLAGLPNMMQALNLGLNLIGWPDGERRAFFGQLMPAHAEALKAPSARMLDINLMAKQVDGALAKPVPSRADLGAPGMKLPVLSEEIVLPKLSAEEARQIGLVDEASINWDGRVDIDVASLAEQQQVQREAEIAACPIGPLPAPAGPVEPTAGRELADHVQVGNAYRMHLDEQWHRVRLVHVSPSRTFYVFTRGERHKRAHTLTHRMLVRLCESGRLRAEEGIELIDRATARARRNLSQLAPLAA